jgi:hypothetical protein
MYLETSSLQKKEKKSTSESKIVMADTLDLIYEAFEKLKLAREEKDSEKILNIEEELLLLRRELIKNSSRKGKVFLEN